MPQSRPVSNRLFTLRNELRGGDPKRGGSRWTCVMYSMVAVLCIAAPQIGCGQDIAGAANTIGGSAAPTSNLTSPSSRDTTVAKLISYLMPKNHISSKQLDDEISGRALDLFIKSLDPLKYYFYQSDIDQFERYRSTIDDAVKAGDLTPAFAIFNRFLTRVNERIPMIQNLLDQPFDFTAEETMVTDPELLTFPETPAEAENRWRKKLKYDLLSLKDNQRDEREEAAEGKQGETKPAKVDDPVDVLRRRYDRYARRWQDTKNDNLLEYFLTAITNGYDPHSTYMSPTTLEDFNIQMRLNLDGIGAQLQEKDGKTTITRVIPGGAADKHGELKPDDVIVSVGQGTDGEAVDIVEMPLTDVVKMIRGPAGTQVRLGVQPGGVGAVQEMLITRARIELEESAARGEVIDHRPADGPPVKIGYINLPSFYMDMDSARNNNDDFRSSTRDVRRILSDFRRQSVDGVVLDLSRNGGGSLTEAISLTGLFIDRGTVVQVKDSNGSVQQYPDEENGTAWDGPLVVMTSKMSASASEILAGAIRDYRRGIVVGDPATHGKGSVQTLMDLGQRLFRNNRKNFGALKVTLQQFYLPDGESTQLKGVPADVILPSLTAKMDIGEGDLDYALEFDRVPASRHSVYNMTPPSIVNQLRQRSMQRVSQDEEFMDWVRRIGLFVQQKENKQISLNEDRFMARRKELDARKEEEEKILEQQMGSEKVYTDYFYNEEVLNITADYIRLLKQQGLAQAG